MIRALPGANRRMSEPHAVLLFRCDAEFAAAWDEIVEQRLDAGEQVVLENALAGKQPVNNIFLLRHRRAHIYGEKVKVEHDQRVDVIVELVPPRQNPSMLQSENVVDAEAVEEESRQCKLWHL